MLVAVVESLKYFVFVCLGFMLLVYIYILCHILMMLLVAGVQMTIFL